MRCLLLLCALAAAQAGTLLKDRPSSGYMTSDTEYFNQKSKNTIPHGRIVDWHAAPFNQVDHSDSAQGMDDADVKLDMFGRIIPKKNTQYNVTITLDCCQKKCQTTSLPLRDQEDCQMGCEVWLRHSSLNWESTKWWPQLNEKCKLDCTMPQSWRNVASTLEDHTMKKAYWLQHPAPHDEATCKRGCQNYFKCMEGQE